MRKFTSSLRALRFCFTPPPPPPTVFIDLRILIYVLRIHRRLPWQQGSRGARRMGLCRGTPTALGPGYHLASVRIVIIFDQHRVPERSGVFRGAVHGYDTFIAHSSFVCTRFDHTVSCTAR